MKEISVYTDGGSRGNPGIGAWAFCYFIKGETEIMKANGFYDLTTNNEMELTAIYQALKYLTLKIVKNAFNDKVKITIYSDSAYCINTLTKWAYGWMKAGTIESRPNGRLINNIMIRLKRFKENGYEVNFEKVAGHSDDVGNELADKLVNMAMDTQITF